MCIQMESKQDIKKGYNINLGIINDPKDKYEAINLKYKDAMPYIRDRNLGYTRKESKNNQKSNITNQFNL